MKRLTLVISILLLVILVLIGGECFDKPKEYDCGLSEFGGPVGAGDYDVCERGWEEVELYKPVCEDLAQGREITWKQACWQVLRKPKAVCTENMENLGIVLSQEEKEECLKRVSEISGIPIEELKKNEN